MRSFTVARPVRVLLLLLAGVTALLAAAAVGAAAATGFSDVSEGSVHEPGIGWMADTGVTDGCGGDRFCPGAGVSRAQVGTFLHRLSGNAPGIAPSVNAARIGGMDADVLLAELATMRAELDVLAPLADRVDTLETELAAVTGELEATSTDLETVTTELQATSADLEAVTTELDATTSALTAAETKLAGYDTLLDGVTREDVAGRDTLRFSGMNVQVVNGTGTTDGEPNAHGNLIIGYDTASPIGTSDKSGSHYLVVGNEHNYTRYGGIIAGLHNTASGAYASVSGGVDNIASGSFASVSGGIENIASGSFASVSGGSGNTASSIGSSVSGGVSNTASGGYASILGGDTQSVSTARGLYPAP